MLLVGFIILFSIGVAIIVKLETDFYFRHSTRKNRTKVALMIRYFRTHMLYYVLAILSLAGSFVSAAV